MKLKKVVYLLGSGATHAVVNSVDGTKGLLTDHLRDFISTQPNKGVDVAVWNQLMDSKTDVEHLISVVETNYGYAHSMRIRELYRKAIIKLGGEFSLHPPANNLYSVLLDFALSTCLDEELQSIVTLNYEDILEQTAKHHHNLEIDYVVTNDIPRTKKPLRVYKLHGSFNWSNERPVQVKRMKDIKNEQALWIPPGVDKKREHYPFNLLWGRVTEEFMNCDIIRVIGCGLSRNDWALIPILYTIQKLGSNKALEIEIIARPSTFKTIENNYQYLTLKGVVDLPEFRHRFGQLFPSDPSKQAAEMHLHFSGNKLNMLADWLDTKIEYALSQDFDKVKNEAKVAYQYFNKS